MLKISSPARRFFLIVLSMVLLCATIFVQNGWQRAAAEQSNPLETDLSAKNPTEKPFGATGAYFEENRGQHNGRVRYMTRGTDATLFLTATEAVYVLRNQKSEVRRSKFNDLQTVINDRKPKTEDRTLALYMTLAGANKNADFTGQELLSHRTNYFKGNDSSRWQTDVPNYGRVSADNIYDGVDVVWHGKQNSEVQYDFIVAPNANPNQIEWQIDGASDVSIAADGSLLIETELGTLRQGKPFSYQETTTNLKQEIESGYAIINNRQSPIANQQSFSVRFQIGSYDRSKPLVIDPSVNLSNLAFSTFLGGAGNDYGDSIAVDAEGNVYITGNTSSPQFPTTAGTFDTSYNDVDDAFVTKLNANGTALIYSTFLGGSDSDFGHGIAVDSSGNVYLTGDTADGTTDYPTTAGAFDTTHNGDLDAFVTKLNASGTALIYSTFLGGSGSDFGSGIAVDSSGNVYLTGNASDSATDYPTTAGAFDTTHNGSGADGSYDAFVTKLNASGTALIYSTFLGGSGNDYGIDIAVDSSGNAYLTGQTADGTTDYPTTTGAFDTTYNGGTYDAFVTKLNASGTALIYSTFLGGNFGEGGFGIAVDSSGNVYLTGDTYDGTTDYPTTPEAFQPLIKGFYEVFVTKLGDLVGPTAAPAGLGGKVRSTVGNVPLPNTTVLLTDVVNPANSRVVVTDQNGDYSFDGVPTGRFYLIFAWRDGFDFNPNEYGIVHLEDNFNLDFLAAPSSPRPAHDFDGDGKSDLAVFRPANGTWYVLESQANNLRSFEFGADGDIPLAKDYDGDGRTDFAVYRPSQGVWYIQQSRDGFKAMSLGNAADKPVPADFDGDGKTDIAVFHESNGTWYRINSSDGGFAATQFGISGDKPVTGDFDGDGKSELTVYRPSSGVWYQLNHESGQFSQTQFGTAEDEPVAADFDGDGRFDVAVFRPSDGTWYYLESADGDFQTRQFGSNSDVPVPADYNGDGRYEQAVFRNGSWFVLRSNLSNYAVQFGQSGDVPTP